MYKRIHIKKKKKKSSIRMLRTLINTRFTDRFQG